VNWSAGRSSSVSPGGLIGFPDGVTRVGVVESDVTSLSRDVRKLSARLSDPIILSILARTS